MPRKESEDEAEGTIARRTRAAANAVTDSPLRRSTRSKLTQSLYQESSSPESVTDALPVRLTRRRVGTMDSKSSESSMRNLRTRKNSASSDKSEITDSESVISRRTTRRSIATALPLNDSLNTSTRRNARAASEVKSSPSVKSRTTRASSVGPEPKALSNARITAGPGTPTRRKKASVMPSEPVVNESPEPQGTSQTEEEPKEKEVKKKEHEDEVEVEVVVDEVAKSPRTESPRSPRRATSPEESLDSLVNSLEKTLQEADMKTPVKSSPPLTPTTTTTATATPPTSPTTVDTPTKKLKDIENHVPNSPRRSLNRSSDASLELGLQIENLLNKSMEQNNKENEIQNTQEPKTNTSLTSSPTAAEIELSEKLDPMESSEMHVNGIEEIQSETESTQDQREMETLKEDEKMSSDQDLSVMITEEVQNVKGKEYTPLRKQIYKQLFVKLDKVEVERVKSEKNSTSSVEIIGEIEKNESGNDAVFRETEELVIQDTETEPELEPMVIEETDAGEVEPETQEAEIVEPTPEPRKSLPGKNLETEAGKAEGKDEDKNSSKILLKIDSDQEEPTANNKSIEEQAAKNESIEEQAAKNKSIEEQETKSVEEMESKETSTIAEEQLDKEKLQSLEERTEDVTNMEEVDSKLELQQDDISTDVEGGRVVYISTLFQDISAEEWEKREKDNNTEEVEEMEVDDADNEEELEINPENSMKTKHKKMCHRKSDKSSLGSSDEETAEPVSSTNFQLKHSKFANSGKGKSSSEIKNKHLNLKDRDTDSLIDGSVDDFSVDDDYVPLEERVQRKSSIDRNRRPSAIPEVEGEVDVENTEKLSRKSPGGRRSSVPVEVPEGSEREIQRRRNSLRRSFEETSEDIDLRLNSEEESGKEQKGELKTGSLVEVVDSSEDTNSTKSQKGSLTDNENQLDVEAEEEGVENRNEGEEEEEEEKSSDEMDSDIAKEYNLDGKSDAGNSDDDVPGDDCRASESEASDPDDEGSDLEGFIVGDDEVEEEEVEDEEDEEKEVSDEIKLQDSLSKPKKRFMNLVTPSDTSEEEAEEMEGEKQEEEEPEPEPEKKESISDQAPDPEKTLNTTINLSESRSKDRKSLESMPNISLKGLKRALDFSMECSTPKSGGTLKNRSTTEEIMAPRIIEEKKNRNRKSLNLSSLHDLETPKNPSVMENTKAKSRRRSSILQRSLPLDLGETVDTRLLQSCGRVKPKRMNETSVPPGDDSPGTKFLRKEKLSYSLPPLKTSLKEDPEDFEEDVEPMELENVSTYIKRILKNKGTGMMAEVKEDAEDLEEVELKMEEKEEDEEKKEEAKEKMVKSGKMEKKRRKKEKKRVEEKEEEEKEEIIETRVVSKDKKKAKNKSVKRVKEILLEEIEEEEILVPFKVEEQEEKVKSESLKKKKKNKNKEKLHKEVEEELEKKEKVSKKKSSIESKKLKILEVKDGIEQQLDKKSRKAKSTIEEIPPSKLKKKKASKDSEEIPKKPRRKLSQEEEPEVEETKPKKKKKEKKLFEEYEFQVEEEENQKPSKKITKKMKKAPEVVLQEPEVSDFTTAKVKITGKGAKMRKKLQQLEEIETPRIGSQPKSGGNVKRLSAEVLETLAEVPERPNKRRKICKKDFDSPQIRPSVSMFSPTRETKTFSVEPSGAYLPLSGGGSTTDFQVVDLQKIQRKPKKPSSAVLSFRQRILARNPRQPISTYLMYHQKQSAMGRK